MNDKKSLREKFRNAVFKRDGYACAICGHKPEKTSQLDAHHITDRNYMPFGGYCAANGISLCTDRCSISSFTFGVGQWLSNSNNCHEKAEHLHATGIELSGYTPTDLYAKIRSSYHLAYLQSLKLEIDANKADAMIGIIGDISKYELEICLNLGESTSVDTWELACSELNELEPLIRDYGKGRYVPDNRTKRCP